MRDANKQRLFTVEKQELKILKLFNIFSSFVQQRLFTVEKLVFNVAIKDFRNLKHLNILIFFL